MTVTTTTNTVVYRGNGSATQFAVPFLVLDEDHLVVRRRVYATGEVDTTYVGTDYSYSGIGDPAGTLTLAGAALDDDYEIVIVRWVPYTQDLDIINAGGFYPATVERQLDDLEMQIQQVADQAERAVRMSVGQDQDDVAITTGQFLVLGLDGQITGSSGTGSDLGLRTDLANTNGAELIGVDGGSVADSVRSLPPPIERYGGGASKTGAQNRDAMVTLLSASSHVTLSAGRTYNFDPFVDGVDPYYVVNPQPIMMLPETLKLFDGRGATVQFASGRGINGDVDRNSTTDHEWAYLAAGADIAAGDVTCTLEAGGGAKFAAGDWVMRRFGSFPYDLPQPFDIGFMRVINVAGDVLTFDRPFPRPFVVASVTEGAFTPYPADSFTCHKTIVKQNTAISDATLRDLNIIATNPSGANANFGIALQKLRNVAIERYNISGAGIGIYIQGGEHVVIDKCRVADTDYFQASVGAAYHFAETIGGVIRDSYAYGTRRFLLAEFVSEVTVEGCTDIIANDPVTNAPYTGDKARFLIGSRSKVVVRDHTIKGFGNYTLDTTSNGLGATYDSQIRFEGRLRMDHPTAPTQFTLGNLNCILDYTIAGVEESWDFAHPLVWKKRIWLKDNMALTNFRGFRGPIKRARITASPGLTFGPGNAVTAFYIGKGPGFTTNYYASLVAGSTTTINFFGGVNGSGAWTARASETSVLVSTAASGLSMANDWIDVEIEIARPVYPSSYTGIQTAEAWTAESDMLNQHNLTAPTRVALETQDPASIADGATGTVTITCTGMTANSIIKSLPARVGGWGDLIIQKVVPGANQCVITLKNETGAPVDLGSAAIELHWSASGSGT